jgi:S-DNA-T family DNA segregation ATPase FtsK/SpoIIIE
VTASALSRRVSEFLGVVLFGIALIWLIALASYSASDPAWFFNTGSGRVPANFAGRVGAFIAELSYQLLGYAAYLVPVVSIVVGWHYFWCRKVDAVYTKFTGAGLLFGCVSAFLSLAFGTVEISGKGFRSGGYIGDRLAAVLAEYLNRSGSIILILTLLVLAIILSTQFSFGRLFSAVAQLVRVRLVSLVTAYRERREDRRRDKQRQEVLKKHLDKAPKEPQPDSRPSIAAKMDPVDPAVARPAPKTVREEPLPEDARKPSRTAAVVGAAAAALKAAASRPTPTRATIKRPPPPLEASLPLSDPEKSPAERKKGTYVTPPLALLDAPRAERKID